jgi:hypothetical protein
MQRQGQSPLGSRTGHGEPHAIGRLIDGALPLEILPAGLPGGEAHVRPNT